MKLGLITYDVAHLKTQQVLFGLRAKNKYAFRLIIVPFVQRAKRSVLIRHRPDQFLGPSPFDLGKSFGLDIAQIEDPDAYSGLDFCLILGAGLLPAKFVREDFLINAHPGLIPMTRGLDALKWALLDGDPIGNSLHFINADIDSGTPIATLETPIFPVDTLDMVCRRHYELEIAMMIDFEHHLQSGVVTEYPERSARKRMPKGIEEKIISTFHSYKQNICAT